MKRKWERAMSIEQVAEPSLADPRENGGGARRLESLRRMRALANHALPEGDPHKLTAQWVSDLRIAANELRVLRRALHPEENAAHGLCARLGEYACIIAEVVETPDGVVQRAD